MGLFSFYTGIVYNDVFSKSLNIFGSKWYVNNKTTSAYIISEKDLFLDPKTSTYDYPYPIGVDPVWQVLLVCLMFL